MPKPYREPYRYAVAIVDRDLTICPHNHRSRGTANDCRLRLVANKSDGHIWIQSKVIPIYKPQR